MRPLLLELFAKDRDDVDALAVTNAAAALLLALDTLANGRQVAVSRGELVAIGGDFRVPSILARSGASLHEVGTTNRTTPRDYEEALEAGAGAILKVRPSNYRIVGFTEEVALPALASLAHAHGVPVIFDAGAGAPTRFAEPALADEPVPLEALDAGADLVCFSGDKTLGGPQAGILIGRKDLVQRAAANPLARALRPDKLVVGALAATLDLHLVRATPRDSLPPDARGLRSSPCDPCGDARGGAPARRASRPVVASTAVATAGGGAGAESTLPVEGGFARASGRSPRTPSRRRSARESRPSWRASRKAASSSTSGASRRKRTRSSATPSSRSALLALPDDRPAERGDRQIAAAAAAAVRHERRKRRVRDAGERDVVDFPELLLELTFHGPPEPHEDGLAGPRAPEGDRHPGEPRQVRAVARPRPDPLERAGRPVPAVERLRVLGRRA